MEDKDELNLQRVDTDQQEAKAPDQPETGTNSPDTKEATEKGVQESQYGSRSYAAPDFLDDDKE